MRKFVLGSVWLWSLERCHLLCLMRLSPVTINTCGYGRCYESVDTLQDVAKLYESSTKHSKFPKNEAFASIVKITNDP